MLKHLLLFTTCFTLTVSAQKNKKDHFNLHTNKLNTSVASGTVSTLYSFSTFTAPYVPITGALLTGGKKWDDLSYSLTIGFTAKLYSQQSTTLSLFEARTVGFNDFNNDPTVTLMAAMFEDLCDRSYKPNVDTEGDPGGTSPISYTTVGTPGSRICKIQVSNAGFFEENNANGVSVSSVNFQTWIYETSGDIEFRYGPLSIQNQTLNLNNGTSGFIAGLIDSLDTNTGDAPRSNMISASNPSAPTIIVWDITNFSSINPSITSGRVYRYARTSGSVGLNTVATNKTAFKVFPNPANDKIKIYSQFDNAQINITNVLGVTVKSVNHNNFTEVNVNDLPAGMYTLSLIANNKILQTQKLVID